MVRKKARKKGVRKIGKDVRKALDKGVAGTVIQEAVNEAIEKVTDRTDRPVKKTTKAKALKDNSVSVKTRKKIVDADAE